MDYLVFDEKGKSENHILLNQVNRYFMLTRKGRNRSRLIIPEPLFVHSDMTTLIQMADLIAYIISWGVQIAGMSASRRPELSHLAEKVMRLRFKQPTPAGHNFGFKLIGDLRPRDSQ